MANKDRSLLLLQAVIIIVTGLISYNTNSWWPLLIGLYIIAVPRFVLMLLMLDNWFCDHSKGYKKMSRWLWGLVKVIVPILFACFLVFGFLKSCTDGKDDCGEQEAKYVGCD